MKAPNLPSLRPRRPPWQFGQLRISTPWSSFLKKWPPSSSSRTSMTLVIVSSVVLSIAVLKSRQKRSSRTFQSSFPSDTSSSCPSSFAVKSYST